MSQTLSWDLAWSTCNRLTTLSLILHQASHKKRLFFSSHNNCWMQNLTSPYLVEKWSNIKLWIILTLPSPCPVSSGFRTPPSPRVKRHFMDDPLLHFFIQLLRLSGSAISAYFQRSRHGCHVRYFSPHFLRQPTSLLLLSHLVRPYALSFYSVYETRFSLGVVI